MQLKKNWKFNIGSIVKKSEEEVSSSHPIFLLCQITAILLSHFVSGGQLWLTELVWSFKIGISLAVYYESGLRQEIKELVD